MLYQMASNQNRQALKTEITSHSNLNSDSNMVYYSFLIETTTKMASNNVIIKTLISKIAKEHRDCQIQIITYNDSAITVFEFDQEISSLKEGLKEIKFSKTSEVANLGLALKACYNNIESTRTDDSLSQIIIISSGLSSDDSSDELMDINSLDNNIVYGLSVGDEESLASLSSLLPDIKVIQMGKNPSQDIKKLTNGDGYGTNASGKSSDNHENRCPINIEIYHHSNETQSIKEDLKLDIIIKPDGNQTVIPTGTKIKFLPSKYYSSYCIQLKQNLVYGKPLEETITLDYKKGQNEKKQQFEYFPSTINFVIELARGDDDEYDEYDDDESNIFKGNVSLNIAYFLAELKSKFKFCIGVEGGIGNGKSTLLNGLVNLFSTSYELEEFFNANRSFGNHVTTSICNASLQDILNSKQMLDPVQQSYGDIDISFSDSWGFISTDVSLKHKAEGRIHHGTNMNDCLIQSPIKDYRIDCFIFVVSIRSFDDKDMMTTIEKKIKEVMALDITPLLAITFCDILSKKQSEEIIKNNVGLLSVQEANTFIINNYTQTETTKDIQKDIQYLRLLSKAVHLCRIKNERDLIDNLKSLSINRNSEQSTPVKSTTTTTTTTASPDKQQHLPTLGNLKNDFVDIANLTSPKMVNVVIDVVIDGEVFESLELVASLNDSISELKNKLSEFISDTDMNAWSIAKESGTVLSESSKLSSYIKLSSSDQEPTIKLILKKRVILKLF